ncbi:uncharacterized protein F4812DRAFT_167008 [Daldinia caldariorum]|uniref:uncharacterized protein n=1 Tax=Daldinia caldariorum TaxID=326644 RepID=UPI002008D883|nr:uncharacterized protein F4812DRAFT_167008 [Daldinia caldariorum]KAI1471123.1 hypothetical protein F4812DRAFT_167008 [Daldinia caldariorum]
MAELAAGAWSWIQENPGRAAVCAAGGVAVAAPALVAGPALAVAGFGANGIVGGSIAAGVQSGIGNVVAGGLFATLQSAAMAGYGAAAVNGVVQVGGALGVVGAVLKSDTPDLRKLNPLERIQYVLNGDNKDGGSWSDFDLKGTCLKSDIVKVAKQSWDDVTLDKLVDMTKATPQLVERLKGIKESLGKY